MTNSNMENLHFSLKLVWTAFGILSYSYSGCQSIVVNILSFFIRIQMKEQTAMMTIHNTIILWLIIDLPIHVNLLMEWNQLNLFNELAISRIIFAILLYTFFSTLSLGVTLIQSNNSIE